MNVEAATARYIDSLGPENLRKAAEYTAGNHWLLLWGLLVSALVTWIVVRWGLLDRLQARLERRRLALQAFLVSLVFLLVSSILSLPWGIYSEWKREVDYGRSSQPIGDFLMQGTLMTIIGALLGALFLVGPTTSAGNSRSASCWTTAGVYFRPRLSSSSSRSSR